MDFIYRRFDNNKRALVLVTDAFGGHGGISKFNRDFLSALSSHPQFSRVVSYPRLVNGSIGQLPHGLDFVTKGVGGKVKYACAVLQHIIHRPGYEIVVCGHINLLWLAWICRIILRIPLVLIMHGVEVWQPTRNRLNNRLVARVDAFISVSEVTKSRFTAWSRVDANRFFIVPNSIDLELFHPAPKNPLLLDRYHLRGKRVLMTLGRMPGFERYKGFDEVMECLPDLVKDIPNVVYLIVGDGDDRARLEQKARSLGIAEHVVFAGRISEQDKVDHYNLADVYVMPGQGEGFGIVYLEAMACGVPTVGSKLDGSREALRDGMLGILVNPKDFEEIRAGILAAIKRPRGVPSGLEYFSYEQYQERLQAIINRVLSGISSV
jgi:phosphatidylinositol alpha-1,6-mannosyltransferase